MPSETAQLLPSTQLGYMWEKELHFTPMQSACFVSYLYGELKSVFLDKKADTTLTFGEIIVLLQNAQHYAEKTAR